MVVGAGRNMMASARQIWHKSGKDARRRAPSPDHLACGYTDLLRDSYLAQGTYPPQKKTNAHDGRIKPCTGVAVASVSRNQSQLTPPRDRVRSSSRDRAESLAKVDSQVGHF